jgi:hypothetical protein
MCVQMRGGQTDIGVKLAHMLHNEPEASCDWDSENPRLAGVSSSERRRRFMIHVDEVTLEAQFSCVAN